MHAEWAKENRAPYPADLPSEPEPGTVEEMRLVLEMAEAICRNISFDELQPDCPSRRWNRPLARLQSKLRYLAETATSVKWDGSGFGYLIDTASMIRMRPLHSVVDKELLRAGDGRCMVCGTREHACQWGFDLARMWMREGSWFLFGSLKTPAKDQKERYERDTPVSDKNFNFFYGRFTVGKTCLRKVHLKFWAKNFLPYLYEWVDERLAHERRDGPLPANDFVVANEENAVFFVKEIETAEHALRTDSASVRLPELPLCFADKWEWYDREMRLSFSDPKDLQTHLGNKARAYLQRDKNKEFHEDEDEDEDEEDEEDEDASNYSDDSHDEHLRLIQQFGDEDAKASVSRRTRARGITPDAPCDDPDEHAREMAAATAASLADSDSDSAKQHKRKGRAGEAAPAQQRKARKVQARRHHHDDDGAEECDAESAVDGGDGSRTRRRGNGRHQRVVTSDSGSDAEDADAHGFSRRATDLAVRHSFATQREEARRKSSSTGAHNHEASCSTEVGASGDVEAERLEQEGEAGEEEAAADEAEQDDAAPEPEQTDGVAEGVHRASARFAVHRLLAIGHDFAAESLRQGDAPRARRRLATVHRIAERLADELGVDRSDW